MTYHVIGKYKTTTVVKELQSYFIQRRKPMGDDLVWMDLTSLAEEKYPDPKEKWIKIKEDSLAFILFSLQEEYDSMSQKQCEADPSYMFQLFNIIKELKSQQK